MNCLDYIEMLSDYLEEDIDGENRNNLEKHIHECEECRKFFNSFKSSVDLYHNMQTKQCPPALEEKLRNLFAEKIQMKKKEQSQD